MVERRVKKRPTYRDLVSELLSAGCQRVKTTATSHAKFQAPNGEAIVVPSQHLGHDASPNVRASVRALIKRLGS